MVFFFFFACKHWLCHGHLFIAIEQEPKHTSKPIFTSQFLVCVIFPWSIYHGYTIRENWLSLSKQLTTTNSSMGSGRISCPVPISMMGFSLTCVYCHNFCEFTCVASLLMSKRHCFIHNCLLLSFCFFFLNYTQALEGEGAMYMIHRWLRIPYSFHIG